MARFPKAKRPSRKLGTFLDVQHYWTYYEVPDALEKLARTIPDAGNELLTDLHNYEMKGRALALALEIRNLLAEASTRTFNPDAAGVFSGRGSDDLMRREEATVLEYTARYRVLAMFPDGKRPSIRMLCFDGRQTTMQLEGVVQGLETLASALPAP